MMELGQGAGNSKRPSSVTGPAWDRVLAGCVHLLSQERRREPHSQPLERRDSGIKRPSDWTWP